MEENKEEKKVENPPAPAKEDPPKEAVKTKAGLDAFTVEELKAFYAKSPQMFKEAGIVKEAKEEKPPDPKPQSAAPAAKVVKYRDAEIKIPSDVQLNEKQVSPYFDHWAEMGWSPEQVQREVDFMVKQTKEATPAQKSQADLAKEEDAKNIAALKADPQFGKNFDKNMEIARRAAAKYFTKDTLSRMTTSDPVLVKQAWEFGKLDAEDRTPEGGSPRTGNEDEDEQKNKREGGKTGLRNRYPNSPTMKFE